MTLPTLSITNGPGQRDLELAFLSRNLGAQTKFTILLSEKNTTINVNLIIYNFSFITAHGANYKLGGRLDQVHSADRKHLPPFNFVFVNYNTEKRQGIMEFSNAE